MNKKIKIIELMQKCANKENIPERILYKNTVFVLNNYKNYYNEEIDEGLLDYILPTFTNLNDYVEILEDNTEEIEEYNGETFEQLGYEVGKMSIAITKGLEKAIKEMRKDLNK